MKMSDVFNLPLKVDGGTVYDLRPSVWLGNPSVENNYWFGIQNTKASELEKNSTALIIAECVNQHDALTQLNKELVEALGSVLWDVCQEDEPNVSLAYLAAASGVLRKALELNK